MMTAREARNVQTFKRSNVQTVLHVVGARPNFMKIAPIMAEMARYPDAFEQILVHTGQHYDEEMSQVFFDDLGIPRPDFDLGVGSGSHAEQTARVMLAFEPVILEEQTDLVLVVGDVNSTLACALVAAKLHVPVAHVEAGLRSFDRTMPEEVNRVLTDQIADLLFTTERDANENLIREGVPEHKIRFVGNVMIDTLLRHKERALALDTWKEHTLKPGGYALLTLHRPSNVDAPEALSGILDALGEIHAHLPILFPAHPRTVERIAQFGFEERLIAMPNLVIIPPLRYLEFLNLMANARLVLTDSGGIQEETTILGIPCLTLRQNTERPVTLSQGTNAVVGSNREQIIAAAMEILRDDDLPQAAERSTAEPGTVKPLPELWDGHAAERIVGALREYHPGLDGRS